MKRALLLALLLPSLGRAQKPAAPPPAPAAPPVNAPTKGATPAAAPAGPPKPAVELEQIKWLAGSWTCEAKAPESPMGPAHSFKATWKNKWDLDNFWLAVDYVEKKS